MANEKIVDVSDAIKNFSIAEEIAQTTDKKNAATGNGKIKKADLLNDDDFNKDLLQEIDDEDESIEQLDDEEQEEEDDQQDPDKLDDVMNAGEFAEILTEVFDIAITISASWGYRKTLVNAEQYDHIQELLAYNGVSVSSRKKMNEFDLWHLKKHQEIQDYKRDEAPLSTKEGERLTKQFRRYLKQKNFQVTPEGGIGIALGSIFLSRAIDCLGNIIAKEYPPAQDPVANEMKDQTKMRIEISPADEHKIE